MRALGLGGITLLTVFLLAGCGAKKPAAPIAEPFPTVELDRATKLVAAGCYDCLKEALDLYERVRATHPHLGVPERTIVAEGIVGTSLVLAIRERELGMLDHGYLDRARAVTSNTSDPAAAATLVDIAGAIPWTPSARPREETFANPDRLRRIMDNRASWRALLESMASPLNLPVGYIRTAFDCAYGDRNLPAAPVVESDPLEPVLAYAKAICRPSSPDAFIALLAREPRLVELEYYIGQRALAARRLDDADAHLTRALDGHPEWPALTLTLGGVAMTAEDTERALAMYDNTLAMVPTQQEARLGRVTALSYLGRYDEAIAMATGLIEEGRWYVGDALYWRAWNKTQLNAIEEAWADISRARTLVVDDKTPKLAGLIAVKRAQYDTAQALFEEARSRNPADCDTAYYLAAVHAQLRHWPPSAGLFSEATTCYDATAEGLRGEIARVSADTNMTPARRERMAGKRTKQREEAIRQAETSSFNAAISYVNVGNKPQAKRYADRAAQTEQFKDKAAELLAAIDKMKGE